MLLIRAPQSAVAHRPDPIGGCSGAPCPRPLSGSNTRTACRASVREVDTKPAQSVAKERTKLLTTLGILSDDLLYLQQHTGVDLASSLSSVKEAHEQVVSLLNPLIGEKVEQEIEDQILQLQQRLQEAHEQVHASEGLLSRTVNQLTQLETSANSIQFAGHEPNSQPAASLSGAADVVREDESAAQPASQQQPESVHMQQTLAASQRRFTSKTKQRHLHSSLALPPSLLDFWYPAEFSANLTRRSLKPVELFHRPWVLFRDHTGKPACVSDTCAHRSCPLSLGQVVNGQVQCAYHGWTYDSHGSCTSMPSTAFIPGVKIDSLPVVEADGLVWVWMGSGDPPPVPEFAKPPPGFVVHAELQLEVPVDHGLLLENLLDLAHAPFTHTTTFAKGWPVPDLVKFKAAQLLGGNWEPYPIDMSFEPPCMVLSTIGLAQPGKIMRGARASSCARHLHQLHVCLPAGPGRTRLLYRMSMDFLGWARHVPFIQSFWAQIAQQVLGEDLVLVAGQQDRLQRGADVWAHPVAYDKLAVRYRRWRNSLSSPDETEKAKAAADLNLPMSAGELFADELQPAS